MLPLRVHGQAGTFAGNAQHTAIYSAPAQHLNAIHWSTSIDTSNTGAEGHYGAPLITAANTVLVPVRTAGGYRIDAFEGGTGRHKYTLNTDFIMPPVATNGWIPVYQPALANPVSGQRLYFPGAGGTVFFVDNVDSDTPGAPIRQCFYTNLTGYAANSNAYNTSIFINTPITPNTNGVIFFGFRAQNTIPAPLNTTNGGFVRLDASGTATYALAGTAANDSRLYRDSHNSAPALSNDGATLYVVAKGPNANFAYLLALDSTTLALKHRVQLQDPRNGQLAGVLDDSTASPLVGPDDDVYFGVFANPNNGSRGFLLHFSADLQTKKTPSAFGWDNTPAIVPVSMVRATPDRLPICYSANTTTTRAEKARESIAMRCSTRIKRSLIRIPPLLGWWKCAKFSPSSVSRRMQSIWAQIIRMPFANGASTPPP
jgi:hypothetical protein